MVNFIYILIILSLIFFIGSIINSIILSNNRLYCRICKRKESRLWEKLLSNLDEIHLTTIYDSGNCVFSVDSIPGARLNLSHDIVTDDWRAYLCNDSECILSSFDKYHSRKMAEALLEIIPKEIDNPNVEDYRKHF